MKLNPLIHKKYWTKEGILNYEVIPTSFSDYNVHIIYCKDIISVRNHQNISNVFKSVFCTTGHVTGLCSYDINVNSILIFIQDPAYVSVIAHESFHAARALLQVMFGLSLSEETNELYASILDNLVTYCLKTCKGALLQ